MIKVTRVLTHSNENPSTVTYINPDQIEQITQDEIERSVLLFHSGRTLKITETPMMVLNLIKTSKSVFK